LFENEKKGAKTKRGEKIFIVNNNKPKSEHKARKKIKINKMKNFSVCLISQKAVKR
jgi:hypothetical protein